MDGMKDQRNVCVFVPCVQDRWLSLPSNAKRGAALCAMPLLNGAGARGVMSAARHSGCTDAAAFDPSRWPASVRCRTQEPNGQGLKGAFLGGLPEFPPQASGGATDLGSRALNQPGRTNMYPFNDKTAAGKRASLSPRRYFG